MIELIKHLFLWFIALFIPLPVITILAITGELKNNSEHFKMWKNTPLIVFAIFYSYCLGKIYESLLGI